MNFWRKEIYTLLKARASNVLLTKVSGPRLFLLLRRSTPLDGKHLAVARKVSPVRIKFLTGFTLLEMLMVVFIVGIIASVTVPRFSGAMERAERAEAVHALSLIRNAELAYNEDYPGDFIGSFAGLTWDVQDETKNFDYTINAGAGTITATNKRAGRSNYRINIVTGAVTEF